MRAGSWLLLVCLLLAMAVGCNREDHDKPKTKPRGKEEAQQAQNKPENNPPPGDGAVSDLAAKKGGKFIAQGPLGAGRRTASKAELRAILQLYTQFRLSHPNKRSLADFLSTINSGDSRAVHDAIKAGYYKVNMNAAGGTDVVAHERDIDNAGYLSVTFDGNVDYLSADQLRKGGGMP